MHDPISIPMRGAYLRAAMGGSQLQIGDRGLCIVGCQLSVSDRRLWIASCELHDSRGMSEHLRSDRVVVALCQPVILFLSVCCG